MRNIVGHLTYIEDIYFFEVNTKYISASSVKKISIFRECVARAKTQIFSLQEIKYTWYLPKKSKFSFYFILNIESKHSLHLENGLESYFNE